MFGPNTQVAAYSKVRGSHRDTSFFELFEECRNEFVEKFNLHDYDILFIPGSGTVGIESILFSLKNKVKVVGRDGVFKRRWEDMAKNYAKKSSTTIPLYCHLETSNSSFNDAPKNSVFIVDAISSFPFVNIPKGCAAFVTSTNKILGSYAGLSIVGVRKDMWGSFISDSSMSYLNLARYKSYAETRQTPSTAPTHLFEHLLKTIQQFDIKAVRNKIVSNCSKLVEAVGESKFSGSIECPALTVNKKYIPSELAEKFELYGVNNESSENYQFFTYSEEHYMYDKFAYAFKKQELSSV